MKHHFWYLFLLYNFWQLTSAVKIGISRPDLTTAATTTTTTTTTTTSTTMNTPSIVTTELPDMSSTSVLTETTNNDLLSSITIDESKTLKSDTPTTLPPSTTTLTTRKTTQSKVTVKPKVKPTTPTTTSTTTTESLKLETVSDNDSDNKTTNEKHEVTRSHSLEHVFCACNLLTEECDINCCCDQDCSKEALQIFDCHIQPSHPELKERLEDFQYQHGLPSCKINDGWLCVFRSNAKVEQKKTPNLFADTSNFYKWSSLMLETAPQESAADTLQHYKFGTAMQLINLDTMDIKNFELPYVFIGSRCHIKEPIGYLKGTRRHCQLNSLDELQQQKQELLDNLSGYKLLKRPLAQMIDAEKAEENLLEIKLTRCVFQNDANDECLMEQTSELQVANYYALEIDLVFRHNFSQLFDCELKFKERKIMSNSSEYWQTFEVKFQLFNEKNKQTKIGRQSEEVKAISGALGYLQGQPIIMAHFVAYNASLEMRDDNRVLNYFHPNATKLRSDHSLLLMSQRHELCYKYAAKQQYINYGINVLKQCKVRMDNTTHLTKNPSDQNFTAICAALQELAMQQLLPADKMKQVWISQLGKPDNNTEHNWTLLQWKNFDFAPVVGVYNEPFQTFTCRNILLNVLYEFQVGNFMEHGVAHQQLVKQATITTGRRHDLEFALTEALELPLTVSVMFYDYASSVGQQLSNGAETIFTYALLYLCALLALV